jgi:hypothetical protein
MSADAGWEDLLDRFEASLCGYGDRLVALDHGSTDPVIPALDLPTDLGPIPPSLEPRANRLVFWATRLEAQLRADLDAVGDEIRTRSEAGRRPSPAAAEPAILDRIA